MTDQYTSHLTAIAGMLRDAGLDPDRAGEWDAAIDILTDDGMPTERAAELMLAALRQPEPLTGKARHIVTLRRSLVWNRG